jgi:glycosyltransferase involved in cell wall biosynthesis
VRIAYYCPNKPLSHPHPSGDLVIARGIQKALRDRGHDCEEMVAFRAREFWARRGGWIEAVWGLLRACARSFRFRPHIWLTYHTYYKSPDVIGPWISRFLRIPYVLFQPMYATKRRKDRRTRMGFVLNQFSILAANHVFVNNIHDMEAMGRILPAASITYLPPGIFPEEFEKDENWRHLVRERLGIAESTSVVMAAARFRHRKVLNLEYLFNALSILRKKGVHFLLLVVGDGPGEEEVRLLAGKALGDRVVFAGGIPPGEMFRMYLAADVFAFPGIGESLGMVYLEAQACGLPVVALNTAGVPQVVRDGETGILVPMDDGGAMAQAIERLIRNPGLRGTIGGRGARYVRRERNLHLNYLEFSRKIEEIAACHPSVPPCP